MFVHNVYFWLEDDLSDKEIAKFEEGVESLTGIDLVNDGFIGVPAGTEREVVDNSYDYLLMLWFEDEEAQDAYQVHEVHKKFVRDCESFWTKVQIYDSVSAGL